MAGDEQISTLMSKHAQLENELQTETNRLHPDQIVVAALKKQKLRIKDEIVRLGMS